MAKSRSEDSTCCKEVKGKHMKVLLVGHLTQDVRGAGAQNVHPLWSWGGSVFYCARVYALMGFDVHVVTALGRDVLDAHGWLDRDVTWHILRHQETTRFINRYDEQGQRTQWIDAFGDVLSSEAIGYPRSVDVLHLCPVFGEVELVPWVRAVEAQMVVMGAQGWLRTRLGKAVVPRTWAYWNELSVLAGKVDALFLSQEDMAHQLNLLDALRLQVPIVAQTHGVLGGHVYRGAQVFPIQVYAPAQGVDPTGAGDVFAAATVGAMARGVPLDRAIVTGAAAASMVVEGPGRSGLLAWTRELDARVAWIDAYGSSIQVPAS